jgi:hypothetical protein
MLHRDIDRIMLGSALDLILPSPFRSITAQSINGGDRSMPATLKRFGLLVLSVSIAFIGGCGGAGSPVPASSSAASEAADAAGGVNKVGGAEAAAPNTQAADAKDAEATDKDKEKEKDKEGTETEKPAEEKAKAG